MPELFGKNDIRCPVCLKEFESRVAFTPTQSSCPNCHTALLPLFIEHDGYFKANWQDLRVLAIYAKRWTAMFDMTNKGNQEAVIALNNIIRSLSKHQPKNAPPLVLDNDVVVIGNIQPVPQPPPKQETIMLDESETRELKPDETGMIPSPFKRKIT